MNKPQNTPSQAPSSIIMVRPHHFAVNFETLDNAYQSRIPSTEEHKKLAYDETTRAAQILADLGVNVHLIEGDNPNTPDAVFPNNWFSTHDDGCVATFPMMAVSRRPERRQDILDMLKTDYHVKEIIDFSGSEPDRLYLESTGAFVLDHVERVAYVVKSDRAHPEIVERFCERLQYEPVIFDAADENGVPIYHTNVLMCIATKYALISSKMISDPDQRHMVIDRLKKSGHEIVDLSPDQIASFAGNAIELQGKDGRILALSQVAYDALTPEQLTTIKRSSKPVPICIPTLELSGGSVRCTIAGIHLTARMKSNVS